MLQIEKIEDFTHENLTDLYSREHYFLCKIGNYTFVSDLGFGDDLGFYVDCHRAKMVFPVVELEEFYLIVEK